MLLRLLQLCALACVRACCCASCVAAGGVWLTGRLFGRPGRLWATVLGAFLGVGAVLLVARLLIARDFAIGWVLMIVLGWAGACSAYYLSGRSKRA